MYRPEIKVLDCTIRDGGLINDHLFEDHFVRAVYQACSLAGVDYVELGYQASKKFFSPDKYGKWKFCDEEHVKKAIEGTPSRTRVFVSGLILTSVVSGTCLIQTIMSITLKRRPFQAPKVVYHKNILKIWGIRGHSGPL